MYDLPKDLSDRLKFCLLRLAWFSSGIVVLVLLWLVEDGVLVVAKLLLRAAGMV